jgi:hypothetical protein
MFDAWAIAGVGGGSAALTYLACGWKQTKDGKQCMRLSLDEGCSLLGDVRLLGGIGTGIASMYVGGADTKKALQTVCAASLLSLVQTEVIRWRLAKQGNTGVAEKLPIFPSVFQKATEGAYGALPGPQASHSTSQRQSAWARR